MKDRYMFKIALATAIIGIVGMMIFAVQLFLAIPIYILKLYIFLGE
ncbi:hypothetical protein [Methanobacterium spitsbergense]|uniref:Uncharacterized protein n=1 Tax=Methanobacterium spitsbergense TaxID=2874285 RepID=A0A8T5USU6_9EURY|nr:hypothetical protein [Methanobacterium spitsbergense]MBZ2165207.1 hypothetical protein [Methanobacterium spitsbergense]